ncbi:MAG TPA: hypothetical protein VGF99_00375 [Myxococcota bacterium]
MAVLPVVRGDDGVWEAMVAVVHGADDVDVREALSDDDGVLVAVRVLGELRELRVYVEGEGEGVVRYDEALPG